jgi:UDP-N-acetylmuramate dehydrogenase
MSLKLESNVCLQPYNSFAFDVRARHWLQASTDEQVRQALKLAAERRLPVRVLGGGSNLLLSGDLDALVLHMASRGIRVLSDDGEQLVLEAEAGERWHDLVQRSLQLGLVGLENLSLIPGTVGAAPVQNIGAYGVELKECFAGLTALDRDSGALCEFDLEQCAFAYRDSVFKRESDRWIILRVRLRLARNAPLHLDYGPVRQRLSAFGVTSPSASDVSRAICSIRREKLPDPHLLGNAGSFFKNPLVSASVAQRLHQTHSDLVWYPQADGQVKLAAGWLIDKAGWRGHREGDAGVHREQALVLVNYGQANGQQILALAQRIQSDIAQRFGVELEIEPNLW